MTLSVANLIEKFRDEYDMTVANYSDAKLTLYINRAVKMISEFYPNKEINYLSTVVDQTRYTVDDANLIKITKVYNTDLDTVSSLFDDPDIQENANYSTFSPSQSFELIKRLETLKAMHPNDAEIVSHDKFDLIPTPDEAGKIVYYEYDKYRTIAEIPDMFEDDIINLCFHYIADKTIKNDVVIKGGNRYTFERRGNITVDNPSSMQSMVKSHKDSYDSIIESIQRKVMLL